MKTHPQIEIQPFQPADQEQVKRLILAGLGEHWGFIDHAKNPDLNDIASAYKKGVFLVARKNGEIIGTGALIRQNDGEAEIVRMSVKNNMRRQGVGKQILESLIEKARHLGCHRVVLETTGTWQEVIAFYLDCGFQITHHQEGDVYFSLEI